jgi:hypothetical protein
MVWEPLTKLVAAERALPPSLHAIDRSGIFATDVASGRRRFVGSVASARAGWRGGGLGIAYHPGRLVRCSPGTCRAPLPRRG